MPDSPRITALKPTKRDPDRVSVHVDGRAAATLHVRSVSELGLTVGQSCDAALLARLQQAAGVDKAVQQSLRRLSSRMLSRGQLDRKLRELGHDEAARAGAIERLERVGLLDDRAYAEALVRQLKRRRPAGPRLLRQKLYEKQIDPKLIDAVLAAERDAGGDAAAALELARTRLRQLGRLDPPARKRRVYALLARRGFEADAIDDALSRLNFSDPPRK